MNNPNNSKKEEKSISIQLAIDEEVAQGRYINFTLANFNKEEFVLDFVFMQPQTGKANVRSRIIVTPANAKRLAMLLMESVSNYEQKYGPISHNIDDPKITLSNN